MVMQTIKYHIRAGSLQPVGAGCPTGIPTEYIYQTFGASKTITDSYDATIQFLKSSDMQGLSPGDETDPSYRNNTYVRASYSGKALRTTDGDMVFSGQEEHVSEFVEEEEVPGWS